MKSRSIISSIAVLGFVSLSGAAIVSATAHTRYAADPALLVNAAAKGADLRVRIRTQIPVVSVTNMIGSTGPSALNIRYDPPTTSVPAISQAQAVVIAEDAMGVMMNQATGIKIQLVKWSKDDYYSLGTQEQKQYVYQNINAWVVVFEGAAFPSQGPSGTRPSGNQEENVAVDATSGKLLGFYTYQ